MADDDKAADGKQDGDGSSGTRTRIPTAAVGMTDELLEVAGKVFVVR